MTTQTDLTMDRFGGLVTICARALGDGLTARQVLADLKQRRISPREARAVLTLAEGRLAVQSGRPSRQERSDRRIETILLAAVGLTAGLAMPWMAAEAAEAMLGLRVPALLGSGAAASDLPATLVGAGAGLFACGWSRRFGRRALVAAGALGVIAFLALAPWIHI